MRRFYKQYWKRKKPQGNGKRSAFGGIVKSHQEVRELNEKIRAHEADELAAYESQMEEALKQA